MVAMRWLDRLKRRTTGPNVNPRKPHAFDAVQDVNLHISAIGAGADSRFGGGSGGGPGAASRGQEPGATDRAARCAVPGCGKAADDPIHRQAGEG